MAGRRPSTVVGTIGIFLLVLGSAWMWFGAMEIESHTKSVVLGADEAVDLGLVTDGRGLGFYKITIADFDRSSVSAEVLGPDGSTVSERRISTRVSVNYFDFVGDGEYAIKITNVDTKPAEIAVDYGDTNGPHFPPAFLIVGGVALILVYVYRRLSDYVTLPRTGKSR